MDNAKWEAPVRSLFLGLNAIFISSGLCKANGGGSYVVVFTRQNYGFFWFADRSY
jgi:hypothetical protein